MSYQPRIRRATAADVPALSLLRHALWPEGSVEEHASELAGVLAAGGSAVFVAEALGPEALGPEPLGPEPRLVGWAEVRLRSHADGCQTSPVGYLEGWYVEPEWRRKGVGAALVAAFEKWALEHGCSEVASDTWLDNAASEAAHLRLGFEVSDRVITFRKALVPEVVVGPAARPPAKESKGRAVAGGGA